MSNVYDLLKKRDFIDAVTSETLREWLDSPRKIYIGFDVTADSLHLGNLIGIIALRWFQICGHTPVALLGGGTTRIGDPSGKSTERPLLPPEEIQNNLRAIELQLRRFLDFEGPNRAIILNNDQWLNSYPLIDFLRDVGKHFRLSTMLAKESVKARLESEEGISFTEFCYQVLQGYDFHYLSEHHNVSIQSGGSDQWGNITAGTDLIRKISGKACFGFTFPLLTRSDGKKFGKSEKGAIWLDKSRCSAYELYQYMLSVPDKDVPKLLKMLTFLEVEEIETIMHEAARSENDPYFAQKRLAEAVTSFIHGDEGLSEALMATKAAGFGGEELSVAFLMQAAQHLPNATLARSQVEGKRFTDVAFEAGLVPSKSEATRLVKGGGAYLNNQKIETLHYTIHQNDLIQNTYLLLGSGKKKKVLVTVTD